MGFEVRTAATRVATVFAAQSVRGNLKPLGMAGGLCLQLASEYVGDHLFAVACGEHLYLDDPCWTDDIEQYAWNSILEKTVKHKKSNPSKLILGRFHAFAYLLHEALLPACSEAGKIADGILQGVVKHYPDVYRSKHTG